MSDSKTLQVDAPPDDYAIIRLLNPQWWAGIQIQLGYGLQNTSSGDRTTNIENAIVAYQRALEVMTYRSMPHEWVRTICHLSSAYLQRLYGEQAENAEIAITICLKALEEFVPPVMLHDLWGPKETVTISAMPPYGAGDIFDQLAIACLRRHYGDRAKNIERAINAYWQALFTTSRETEPAKWAATKLNMANACLMRIEGNRADNINKAIANCQDALEVLDRQSAPEDWTKITSTLASAYLLRPEGNHQENVKQAIDLYKEVLTLRTRETTPFAWATTVMNLANAYLELGAEAIEHAIDLYKQALTVRTREKTPLAWADTMCNLALAYSKRINGEKSENVKQAILCCRHGSEEISGRANPTHKLAALKRLGDLCFDDGRWQEAQLAFSEAIDIARDLVEVAFYEENRRSEVIITANLYIRCAYCFLRLGQYEEALVQMEAGKTQLLALAVALSQAKLDWLAAEDRESLHSLRETIPSLEEAKEAEKNRDEFSTKLDEASFIQSLSESRGELRRLIESARALHSNFMPTNLALPDILALIPDGGALVAPLFTSCGSAVFIVPHGATQIAAEFVLRLDDFTTADLDSLLRGTEENPGWLRDYQSKIESRQDWMSAIETNTARLWDRLVEKIYTLLTKFGVRRVLFMPQGGLGILPLHAAWREVNGTKRYFMDDFEVSYASSAYALDTARRRVADQRGRTAVIAGVSQYERYDDLPNVRSEVETMARLFGTNPLLDSQVRVQEVKDKVRGANYVHLACHGTFGWGKDPLAASLYLANDNPLSLSEIISRLDLKSTRLATLSACETGIIDVNESPDEFLGLTAGFMQAGASGVVSSLWTVNDRSTALLMERFYRNHLEENGMEPVAALREAQLWLRDLTREKLSEHFKAKGDRSASRKILLEGPPFEKLYESPYYWAAFTYNGI